MDARAAMVACVERRSWESLSRWRRQGRPPQCRVRTAACRQSCSRTPLSPILVMSPTATGGGTSHICTTQRARSNHSNLTQTCQHAADRKRGPRATPQLVVIRHTVRGAVTPPKRAHASQLVIVGFIKRRQKAASFEAAQCHLFINPTTTKSEPARRCSAENRPGRLRKLP